jgi:hypothetical protein
MADVDRRSCAQKYQALTRLAAAHLQLAIERQQVGRHTAADTVLLRLQRLLVEAHMLEEELNGEH